ncbi:MAG TPA: hypothetical protein VFA94_12430 [Acidimicrobiales bacterium]|nr:hypothetical protein [Acidimicrobiales bacterium]
MTRAIASVVAVLAVALAGCGASASASNPLRDAQSGLGKVHRGTMLFKLTAGAGPTDQGKDVGFQLQGPFDLSPPDKTSLPVARLELTQLLGGQTRTTTFVSTGERAYVEAGGKTVELSDAQVQPLRLDRSSKRRGELGGLSIAKWGSRAQESDPGVVDGVAVRRITAVADPVRALNDVFALAGQLGVPGQGTKRIAGQDAEQLRALVKSSQLEVLVGKADGLVRDLRLNVLFGGDAPAQLQSALGELAASRLALELRVDRPNQSIGEVVSPAR